MVGVTILHNPLILQYIGLQPFTGFKTGPGIVQFCHHDWSEILVQEPIQDWTGASRAHADNVAHTKQCHKLGLRLQVKLTIKLLF